MRFMILVPASKESEAGVLPDGKLLEAMGKFNEELVKSGVLLAGDGLQPTSKGARIHYGAEGTNTRAVWSWDRRRGSSGVRDGRFRRGGSDR